MNPIVRDNLLNAQECIHMGSYDFALAYLHDARRALIGRGRAWSKIMLAIRELSRIAPSAAN